MIAKLSQMDEKPILSCHGLVDIPSKAEHKRLTDDDDSLQITLCVAQVRTQI